MTRLEYYILRSRPVQAMNKWLKGIVLPGFEGVSLFDSLNFFKKQIFSNRFNSRANAVSFSFIMALPPLLLFFFSLVPYLPLSEVKLVKMINEMLTLMSPGEKMQQTIARIIRDFIRHKKNVLLSFSVLLTIFYSSNGMMGLMKSFEKQMPGFKKRSPLKMRGIAILLTFLMILAVFAMMGIMFLHSWVAAMLGIKFLKSFFVLKLLAYTVFILFCFITVSFAYKYGTATVTKWKLVSPGAVMATVLILLLTVVFFYAVNNLVNYNKIYGSISTLIIFLIWVNFMAQVLLIGFELNASIIVHRKAGPELSFPKEKKS
jgi:membrane protein